ncbi:LacI family DNA-binding transcriptional regulator [soil metagenome]
MTLETVARDAGVALATASRVLSNGSRVVAPALRERVLDAAGRLRYIPNAHAQALAGASPHTVGVILHDVADPYFSAIAGGVMRVAHEHGLLVMMASTFRDPEREIAYVSMLHAQRARAILLIGSGFENPSYSRRMAAELGGYRATGGRVACVSNHSRLPADVVAPNNVQGAADLADELLAMGHRRFAVVTGPEALTTVKDRLDGFTRRLAEAGVDLPTTHRVGADFTRDGGYAAMSQLLSRRLDVSAVFVLNDVMAIGALSACREVGVRVPEDLSLAGFDDIPIVRDLDPPLSTVRLPLDQLGAQAMSLALDELSDRRRVRWVDGEVVLRASTRPPP